MEDNRLNGSPTLTQDWSLDATGNWNGFDQGVVNALSQTRTQNAVNEITDISRTVGDLWPTPEYDLNGNTTLFPDPRDLTSEQVATYDAWNRLVRLEEPNGLGGLQPLAEFQYDGMNRCTVKMSYSGGSLQETRHAYFSDQWQVLEERIGTSTTAERQFVWGLRYIDDLILRDRSVSGTLDERHYEKLVHFWYTCWPYEGSVGIMQTKWWRNVSSP
jgi:hypothetical protein